MTCTRRFYFSLEKTSALKLQVINTKTFTKTLTVEALTQIILEVLIKINKFIFKLEIFKQGSK